MMMTTWVFRAQPNKALIATTGLMRRTEKSLEEVVLLLEEAEFLARSFRLNYTSRPTPIWFTATFDPSVVRIGWFRLRMGSNNLQADHPLIVEVDCFIKPLLSGIRLTAD